MAEGLAIVGAAVGFAIGGPQGAQLGFAIGSTAGNLLFPPKGQDGPRLEDRAIQVSTYGQPIPRVYGVYRSAGNVIFSTELLETETEQGKGGPSYSTFSYRASFAVAICSGPIVGIRRIWADGKLIYDLSGSNTGPQQDFTASSLVIYTGTETQLPDPTIQAYKGDTPAYRGIAYAVFTDLQLEKFGNRIPNLTFEVVQSGTVGPRPSELVVPTPIAPAFTQTAAEDTDTGYVWTTVPNDGTVIVYEPASGTVLRTIATGFTSIPMVKFCQPTRTFWVSDTSSSATNNVNVYSADTFAQIATFAIGGHTLSGFDPIRGSMVAGSNQSALQSVRWINVGTYAQETFSTGESNTWLGISIPEFNQFFLTGQPGYLIIGSELIAPTVVAKADLSGFVEISDYNEMASLDTSRQLVYRASGAGLDPRVAVYDPATRSHIFRSVTGTSVAFGAFAAIHYHAPTDTIIIVHTAEPQRVYQVDPDTFAVIRGIDGAGGAVFRGFCDAGLLNDRLYATTAAGLVVIYLTDTVNPAFCPLPDVIEAESALVGLELSDLDTSDLDGLEVQGFATSGGAVRSNIEQLMMGYSFDEVESGGLVKFVRRGGDPVAVLDDIDLAAHQPGNDVPSPLPLSRAEETELPRSMTIRYNNPASDYQVSAQTAYRLTGRAVTVGSIDLPLVLSDAAAAQLAESGLYSAWTSRTSTSFTTTLRQGGLEPTDVVEAGGNLLRITKRTENAGILTFEAAFDSGAIYSQTSQGIASDTPQQTIPFTSKTALEFLDLPPLRDQDDDAGFYLAAGGYRAGWTGALIYKSTDSGQSYEEFVLMQTATVTGSATTVLAARDENTFDEINSVTVWLRNGQLYSASELAVLAGANGALLGNEIFQFKTATLNVDGSYTLRDLLRGRKGTPTSGHAMGDRFVLLNPAALRRTLSVTSEIGVERLYKPVSLGATLDSASAIAFTNTAQSLKPLAPIFLGGGRNPAGDIAIQWVRRSRVGAAWRDFVDAPLAEAAESYEVDVFADNTYAVLKRTIASSTKTITYTAAQQVTDFGSAQSTVYVRVYQLSATVGRGRALQGSV